MITKTICLALAMSLSLMTRTTNAPRYITVDIDFCDFTTRSSEKICNITEAETASMNKIFLDDEGDIQCLLIDKRSIKGEKLQYIFSRDVIEVEQTIVLHMPFLDADIQILPGVYDLEKVSHGYQIYLSGKKHDVRTASY